MNDLILFHFPAACSRVTMTALEEIGLSFEARCVNFRKEAQCSAEYLAVNPKAKVPALSIRGHVMTENAAILAFLNRQYPDAGLLPHDADPVLDNQGSTDLVWCSSTLHPMVRQIRMPMKWTLGDSESVAGVKADGLKKFAQECRGIAARVANGWWYPSGWSIVDVYLYWAYSTAAKGGFPLGDYSALVDHAARVRARPSFQRALARERAAVEAEGIAGIEL